MKKQQQQGLSISLHVNGNITSRCLWYLVVEQKEPLWKQLPRGPPSGRRDTACPDFQRGCCSKCYETGMIHFSLELPGISWFRYYSDSSQLHHHHHHNTVSLLMIPVWVRLILEHRVYIPMNLSTVSALRGYAGKKQAQKGMRGEDALQHLW